MASSAILLELGLILGIAAVLALVGRAIRQPPIIAYLVAGILVGPLFFDILHSHELIELFASIGVTFLLFIVGLSLDFGVLKQVGKVALAVGIGQVILTSVAGFLIATSLGFSPLPAMYIAAALAFSSTLFVMDILADKKELNSLHGKIAVGALIVQDFIAVIALLIMPLAAPETTISVTIQQLGLGVAAIAGTFLVSHIVMPRILTITAKDQEILFLVSIGWALVVALAFTQLGLTAELGALIAGMSLASSRFSLEIGSKVKGLREFFVTIHLIFFGSLLAGPISGSMIFQAVIFSLLILIGNPLIIMTIMRSFGYTKRTNFLTGISIAQISEFSLILMFLGLNAGAITQEILSLTILIALITIAVSNYGLYYSKGLYNLFSPLLNSFEGKKKPHHLKLHLKEKYDIVLFGYNRIGYNLLKSFHRSRKKYLIVDYDPDIIANLKRRNITCVYGDANDTELLKEINLREAKIVLSTIPDLQINRTIHHHIPTKKTMFIPTAHDIDDARALYEAGADYVIMPHFLGGQFMGTLLGRSDFSKALLKKHTARHLKELREREFEGHTHPKKYNHGR